MPVAFPSPWADMVRGFQKELRAKAIEQAITEAQTGDIVLIAGKGHETTQTMRGETIAFDDRKIAQAALEARR